MEGSEEKKEEYIIGGSSHF